MPPRIQVTTYRDLHTMATIYAVRIPDLEIVRMRYPMWRIRYYLIKLFWVAAFGRKEP